jgi:hypothetical protein
VTVLMTVEAHGVGGAAPVTGDGVSFIADNLVHLRYVPTGRGRERELTVIKARGVNHASDSRALVIGGDGLRVVPRPAAERP